MAKYDNSGLTEAQEQGLLFDWALIVILIDVYVLAFEQEDSDYLELSNLVVADTLVDIRTVLTEREDKKFYIVEKVRR